MTPEEREQMIQDLGEDVDTQRLVDEYGQPYIDDMIDDYKQDMRYLSDEQLLQEYREVCGNVPDWLVPTAEPIPPDPNQSDNGRVEVMKGGGGPQPANQEKNRKDDLLRAAHGSHFLQLATRHFCRLGRMFNLGR